MAATLHCGETRELSKRGLDILVLKNEFSSRPEDLEARPLAFARRAEKENTIMAEVLLNPDTSNNTTNSSASSSSSSGHPNSTRSNKKRLNWLNWMRKSLDRSNRSKLCSCGFFHHNNDRGHESTTTTTHSDWPVFTMSQSGTYF